MEQGLRRLYNMTQGILLPESRNAYLDLKVVLEIHQPWQCEGNGQMSRAISARCLVGGRGMVEAIWGVTADQLNM